MRNIETFPSKQMYPYLSLDERKVAEFYHNIDRRRYFVWLKWLIFITFSGQLMVSLQSFLQSQHWSHKWQTIQSPPKPKNTTIPKEQVVVNLFWWLAGPLTLTPPLPPQRRRLVPPGIISSPSRLPSHDYSLKELQGIIALCKETMMIIESSRTKAFSAKLCNQHLLRSSEVNGKQARLIIWFQSMTKSTF